MLFHCLNSTIFVLVIVFVVSIVILIVLYICIHMHILVACATIVRKSVGARWIQNTLIRQLVVVILVNRFCRVLIVSCHTFHRIMLHRFQSSRIVSDHIMDHRVASRRIVIQHIENRIDFHHIITHRS